MTSCMKGMCIKYIKSHTILSAGRVCVRKQTCQDQTLFVSISRCVRDAVMIYFPCSAISNRLITAATELRVYALYRIAAHSFSSRPRSKWKHPLSFVLCQGKRLRKKFSDFMPTLKRPIFKMHVVSLQSACKYSDLHESGDDAWRRLWNELRPTWRAKDVVADASLRITSIQFSPYKHETYKTRRITCLFVVRS